MATALAQRCERWRILAVAPLALVLWCVLAVGGGGAFAASPTGQEHANPSAPGQARQQPASTDTTSTDSAGTDATTAESDSQADHSSGTAGTSGDPSQPQPKSNADQNPGGANNGGDCGAYCSTRDGSASGNGNGDGKATGKPCAGCVGKADNKNPPGQRPDASDGNQGYECDGNNGIGKTNPAHTGCTTRLTPQIDCTTNPALCPQQDCTTTPALCPQQDCVPSVSNNFCVPVQGVKRTLPPETEVTQPPSSGTPTTVLGERFVRTPHHPPLRVLPQANLPFTGDNSRTLVPIGAAAVLLGLMCVAAGRRRRT